MCGMLLSRALIAENVTVTQCIAITTGCRVIPLNLVASDMRGFTPSRPPTVSMAFKYTPSIRLHALSLYTANLPTRFRNAESDS